MRKSDISRIFNSSANFKKAILYTAAESFPVYILNDFSVSAWYEKGISPYKCIVCSFPKAGTYLFEKILSEIGVKSTKLHLGGERFTDYRFLSLRQARENYDAYNVYIPLEESLRFIQPGQFAVSHMGSNPMEQELVKDFKVIFVYRNLRDCFVSWVRFYIDTERCGKDMSSHLRSLPDNYERILEWHKNNENAFEPFSNTIKYMIGWLQTEVFKLSYETINCDYGQDKQSQALDSLCDFLGVDRVVEKEEFFHTVLNTSTLTWSGKRTQWTEYWNPEVEEIFKDMGCVEINRKLGYE